MNVGLEAKEEKFTTITAPLYPSQLRRPPAGDFSIDESARGN
jgi:hypothetical protein